MFPQRVGKSVISELERSIYDDSPLGVVERDMENLVCYANKAALEIMGTDHYEGLALGDVFSDADAQRVLAEQTEERRNGLLGNYRVLLTRLDDRARKVEVQITALPLLNDNGAVTGSLGIFRSLEQERLTEEIRQITLTRVNRDDLLRLVAEKIRTVLPYDLLMVSRINAKDRESEAYFTYPLLEQDVPSVWFRLTPEQMAFMDEKDGGIHDFEAVMRAPPWDLMNDEPMIQQMRRMGLKTSMWRRVRQGDQGREKTVASITLLSTRVNAYDSEDQKLFSELPLIEAVLGSLDNEQRELDAQRIRLFRQLNQCMSAKEAGVILTSALVKMFGWSHVSLFRVDHSADLVILIGSAWHAKAGGANGTMPEYEQHITAGVLGRVVDRCSSENVGDVSKDRAFLRGPNAGKIASELAVPIIFAGDTRVRFIINVDDPRHDAFSQEHETLLKEVADEVAIVMQRISQIAFLAGCFDSASDPIIATDGKLRIRKVNPAAATLLGFFSTEAVQGRITDYFEDAAPFKALKTHKNENLGELKVKQRPNHQSAASVFVTRKDFPNTLGGHVFIARDLTDIRQAVQLEFLENAAYEIATETQAPLTLAINYLEKLAIRLDEGEGRELEKALRQLGRVKNSYTRLAMYNREARTSSREVCAVNVNGELHALMAMLSKDEFSKIDMSEEAASVEVDADHTQVAIVLETVLSVLLRAAPEKGKVYIRIAYRAQYVEVCFKGKLPLARQNKHEGVLESARADLRRADPLLKSLMKLQNGKLDVRPDVNGETEFVLLFPQRRQHG